MRMIFVIVMSIGLTVWIASNAFVSAETILNVIRH